MPSPSSPKEHDSKHHPSGWQGDIYLKLLWFPTWQRNTLPQHLYFVWSALGSSHSLSLDGTSCATHLHHNWRCCGAQRWPWNWWKKPTKQPCFRGPGHGDLGWVRGTWRWGVSGDQGNWKAGTTLGVESHAFDRPFPNWKAHMLGTSPKLPLRVSWVLRSIPNVQKLPASSMCIWWFHLWRIVKVYILAILKCSAVRLTSMRVFSQHGLLRSLENHPKTWSQRQSKYANIKS